MVSPVRPTRKRAPGISPIWPNTNAVLSRTPVRFISNHSSLPSRVRSPMPVNTETPPCSVAILRISSCTNNVLPTPAPPNSPIFEPLIYGHIISITLIPVSCNSSYFLLNQNAGASRKIGHLSCGSLIGGLSSIGLPKTLKIRPSTFLPTGTLMGLPVSITGSPRLIPKIFLIAIQRTMPSPSC